MNDATWLDRWLPLLAQHAKGRPVLELGCGPGLDTARLLAAGHAVVAIDRDAAAVAAARERAPAARIACQDILAPWPQADGGYGAIVASLSLHYFRWADTVHLVERLHRQLGAGGLLLCRLNSTNDHHHGASGHPAIEPNYFDVRGEAKRFFDRASVEALFLPAWRLLSLQEVAIDRYAKPKTAWELIAQAPGRAGAAPQACQTP